MEGFERDCEKLPHSSVVPGNTLAIEVGQVSDLTENVMNSKTSDQVKDLTYLDRADDPA